MTERTADAPPIAFVAPQNFHAYHRQLGISDYGPRCPLCRREGTRLTLDDRLRLLASLAVSGDGEP